MPLQQDKLLFTPGPLTTSATVKEAMLHDVGSRDDEFGAVVRDIRRKLLDIAGVSTEHGYETIPIQGSGTSGIEAVLSSVIPADGKLLIIMNGAYGSRLRDIAERHRIATVVLEFAENVVPDPSSVRERLSLDEGITHVAMVHCETSSGLLNPVSAVGSVVRQLERTFIVDAMSSFGGIPLNVAEAGIHFLISSANKCLEGTPGFSFVIADRAELSASGHAARTVSLDLLGQWRGLEDTGQFRFTPPTQVMLGFHQALRELDEEGGVEGRARRYATNQQALLRGMRRLGFREYLPAESQSYIISTFLLPEHPNFDFTEFHRRLSDKGMVIYPGKLRDIDAFRIGTIGRITEHDIESLLGAVETTLSEMNVAPVDHVRDTPIQEQS
jgi:2-aminoethylphosphonate-pyruvate transaminase